MLALEENTYVDDLQAGGETEEELIRLKNESSQILRKAGFQLHKWHSNVNKLESDVEAKSTKLLGIPWNKETDQLSIDFTACINNGNKKVITKRKMLSAINSVFDLLGFSAPVLITGKLSYSQLCLLKLGWNQQIPNELSGEWQTWINKQQKNYFNSVERCLEELLKWSSMDSQMQIKRQYVHAPTLQYAIKIRK